MGQFLKIPIYLMDEGPRGALLLFLIAAIGFAVAKLGAYIFEISNSCLIGILGQFLEKMGIGLTLTGIISGIISLL